MPFPLNLRVNGLLSALIGPDFTAIVPLGERETCPKNTASTLGFSIHPSSIILKAPPIVSSAGWKKSLTLPFKLSLRLDKILAAPKSIVV